MSKKLGLGRVIFLTIETGNITFAILPSKFAYSEI